MSVDVNKPYKIGVLGGGAAGLFAAVNLAREAKKASIKLDVTIIEANSRVGKKLLATGNGRCNLTNADVKSEYYSGNIKLFEDVYTKFTNKDTVSFFNSCGLLTKTDFAGRVYPLSNQASGVLDIIRSEAERLGVNVYTETKVSDICKKSDKIYINSSFEFDFVIVACGGKASPVHGSDGSGFELLSKLGVKIDNVFPALTPLIAEKFTKSLKGIRADGQITVKCNGKVLSCARGEIQYTDYGLSGIPAMQVSYAASELFCNNKSAEITAIVDSAPSLTKEELFNFLTKASLLNRIMSAETLIAGIMPKRLGTYLITECSLNPVKPLFDAHSAAVNKLCDVIKNKKYRLTGVKGFLDAQVSGGGIAASEINNQSLELKNHKRIFVCGEMLGVTGTCGGYNLQWAWSSAYVSAKGVIEEILNCLE